MCALHPGCWLRSPIRPKATHNINLTTTSGFLQNTRTKNMYKRKQIPEKSEHIRKDPKTMAMMWQVVMGVVVVQDGECRE